MPPPSPRSDNPATPAFAPGKKVRKPADYLIVKEVTVSRALEDGTKEPVLLLMPMWAGTDPDIADAQLIGMVQESEEGDRFRLFRLKRTLSKATVSKVKLIEG